MIPSLLPSCRSSPKVSEEAYSLGHHDFRPELIESEKPDIVIIECVERYIHMLTTENPPEVRAAPKDLR